MKIHDINDFPVLSGKIGGTMQFIRDFLQDLAKDNQVPSKQAMEFIISQLEQGMQVNDDLFETIQHYRRMNKFSLYKTEQVSP